MRLDRKIYLWKKSIGKTIDFVYDDIIGSLLIVGYNKNLLQLKYGDKMYDIYTSDLLNCNLYKILRKPLTETHPDLVKYFIGGYDEAKNYSQGSSDRIYVKCPICGEISNKKVIISNLIKRKTIPCIFCNDGISYSEKFIYALLNQLSVNFIYQLSNKTFKWIDSKRYDFYIPQINCIIEINGSQHYTEKFKIDIKLVHANDEQKRMLALNNNIKYYIILDCRKSELEFIKKSILSSSLPKLLNFNESSIDWIKCELFACSNMMKCICDIKNTNPNYTSRDISILTQLSLSTIIKYLKRGNNCGLCSYNAKEEQLKSASYVGKSKGKKVEVFLNGESLGIYNSCHELDRISLEKFGVNLNYSSICKICRQQKGILKGFFFKYVL